MVKSARKRTDARHGVIATFDDAGVPRDFSFSRFTPEEMREFFRIIVDQANHMRGLISDLLDAGRIHSGTLSVATEPSQVTALVERARGTFLSGVGGRQAVVVDLPAGLPPVMATAGASCRCSTTSSRTPRATPPSRLPFASPPCTARRTSPSRSRTRGAGWRERFPYLFSKPRARHLEGAPRGAERDPAAWPDSARLFEHLRDLPGPLRLAYPSG